ncbi:MAG: hypothetical protein JWQ97_2622, partial [Phenylobacterium sp.]|nr:hypothetical protein [Phenylobacterium sp.]
DLLGKIQTLQNVKEARSLYFV